MATLIERARSFQEDLVTLRRDLHRHPELSFAEERTARRAADEARALGFAVREGVGRTGVVAELRNGPGPTVALRADMDALPIQEENEAEYRSMVPNVMHACGHDAHVAMVVGAARLLAEARAGDFLPAGSIRLLFQPSEESADQEGRSGAARMVEDGAMEGVDAVFGLHIGSHLPSGTVHLRPGPQMAGSDSFRVTVRGTSAHAARPEEGTDAVVLAAHFVLACQNAVARRISPMESGVLTIGTVRGGVAENVLAERVDLSGTVRYFREEVREALHQELRRAASVVDSLGGTADLDLRPGYPPLVNDPGMTRLARAAIQDLLGSNALVEAERMMGAEDFALLLHEAPGAFLWVGAALDPPREHHHPRFDIDESALAIGAATLASCALRALREAADIR